MIRWAIKLISLKKLWSAKSAPSLCFLLPPSSFIKLFLLTSYWIILHREFYWMVSCQCCWNSWRSFSSWRNLKQLFFPGELSLLCAWILETFYTRLYGKFQLLLNLLLVLPYESRKPKYETNCLLWNTCKKISLMTYYFHNNNNNNDY